MSGKKKRGHERKFSKNDYGLKHKLTPYQIHILNQHEIDQLLLPQENVVNFIATLQHVKPQ